MKLFIFIVYLFWFSLYSMANKKPEWIEFTYPEVLVENRPIEDFCKTTLVPILREHKFNIHEGVLILEIKDFNEWHAFFYLSFNGIFDSTEYSKRIIVGFCMIEGFPMKVVAPSNCPFIKKLPQHLTLKHQDSYGIDGDYSWEFAIKNNELVLVQSWLPYFKSIEGKKLNLKTGFLE